MLAQSTLIERFRDGASTGNASHLFAEGDVLYSYGHHFPLVVRRDWGEGIRFLLNGDRYSRSTSAHQQLCIRGLKPNVQIPFSALAAARLTDWRGKPTPEMSIIDWQPDRYYDICVTCRRDVTPLWDSGDSSGKPRFVHVDDCSPLCPDAEGRIASEHQLGAVVLEFAGACYLSSTDANENWRTRSYFLCQLPESVANVGEAFDALVPDAVREAMSCGLEVRRQGDIFVVATAQPTRTIRGVTSRQYRVFDTTHVASEARVNGAVYLRGVLRHQPPGRRPQHAPLQLGKRWWIAYRNTALGSWNAAGSVD